MTTQIGSGTAQGLIEFLDQLVEKGRAASGSVNPLKTATRQVLSSVEGEDKWSEIDIRSLDVVDYIERFKNLTMGKYTAESYKTYQSRLSRAKEWYTTFLVNPGWTPSKSSTLNKTKPSKKAESTEQLGVSRTEVERHPERKPNSLSQGDLIAYPFPLLTGRIVNLYLPVDLKISDAKRIARFVESLSIDSEVGG